MLRSIDLRLAKRLREDPEFRKEWFRAELEAGVPERFRELREARDLTQAQLAEIADMKQSAISRFEKSNEVNWKIETLQRLAESLDAMLQISVVPAEEVIAQYELSETHENWGGASVLDASPQPEPLRKSALDMQKNNELQPPQPQRDRADGASKPGRQYQWN